jgi:argininosuccinate lyase
VEKALQWGGRFLAPPNEDLLAFGSSLEDDLVLAPFDVLVSRAHVSALEGGGVIDSGVADSVRSALDVVAAEIESGGFASYTRESGAEDVHGAIDARVREIAPHEGAFLHSGRSRNDQVATTLALYAHNRALAVSRECISIARLFAHAANAELEAGTLLCGVTHWQPAQPVLFAFYLQAAAEPFARNASALLRAGRAALATCPLGSAAIAGSTLPLDRHAACNQLGFVSPSRNAMDAIGSRDAVLDVADAAAHACISASRVAGELVVWATPAFGYVHIGDASATGSSLMPQKRNPDIFELTRGCAHEVLALANGARSTLVGMPLSYHRDLQQTKRQAIACIERSLATVHAFATALADVTYDREAMIARADEGFAIATDVADALILRGASAREAHATIGTAISNGMNLASFGGPVDARSSVEAKATIGSTSPRAVAQSLASLAIDLDSLEAKL